MRQRMVRIEDFVERLRSFEREPITRDRIAEYCGEHRLHDGSLAPYLRFRPDRYTRNLVFRDPLFEVMIICWQPGQRTPVHSHNGQLGWMLVERGALGVANFRYLSCDTPEKQNVVGLDCLAGSSHVQLEPTSGEQVWAGGPVSTVDKIQTIHRLACPAEDGEPAVSVHIYSVPFESCVTYDVERGTCGRRSLFWDSRYGQDEAAAAPPAGLPIVR